MLTLHGVAMDPSRTTWQVRLPTGRYGCLRPLEIRDEGALTCFLDALGPESRTFYDVSEPKTHASEMCEAIDRYDKLRFVLESGRDTVVGLVEFSFGLPEGDRTRFAEYGITLMPGADVRFGACLADALQGRGLATELWPKITEVARKFACSRILLWGGVLGSNRRAERFYRRVGFEEVGRFARHNGDMCIDMMIDLCNGSQRPRRSA